MDERTGLVGEVIDISECTHGPCPKELENASIDLATTLILAFSRSSLLQSLCSPVSGAKVGNSSSYRPGMRWTVREMAKQEI